MDFSKFKMIYNPDFDLVLDLDRDLWYTSQTIGHIKVVTHFDYSFLTLIFGMWSDVRSISDVKSEL